MKFRTGQGSTISLFTMIAIWSISAITSLPGLAISPIMGDLTKIFPHTTNLEIQMLTSLPSLLIIPFVLLSGRLAINKNKMAILTIGLVIFLLSGIMYMFANSITELIVISCILGIGAGIVIPLSTGLIADFFTGKYRIDQLGLSSSITNVTLVLATLLTGWLANFNWHYPFIVYTVPIISILLIKILKISPPTATAVTAPPKDIQQSTVEIETSPPGYMNKSEISKLMLLYFFITYIVTTVAINLPFLIEARKINSSATGGMIAVFFLAIMLPGLFLNKIIFYFKQHTNLVSLLTIGIGLFMIAFLRNEWLIGAGCFFTGLGYGIMQPIIYDKTVDTTSSERVTFALAFVMSVNYLAILVCPFIVDAFQKMFDTTSNTFPFVVNGVLTLILALVMVFRHNGTILGMRKSYYEK